MHCFVDISSHGFGHLAITAPILNQLAKELPDLRLTIRSALPPAQLARRIDVPYALIEKISDIGFLMHDTLRVDIPGSADVYRQYHRDWATRVEQEAAMLCRLDLDLVLSNISYLPLAGAARAGIPSLAICSLNWADLFAHFFADQAWGLPIHAEMLAAYRSARAFLRPMPSMPMCGLPRMIDIGPVCTLGQRRPIGEAGLRYVLIAMGGIAHRLPVERWPRLSGIRWLVPTDWQCRHPDAVPFESFNLPFTDLLASVHAVITKPGYGMFTEAACNGIPVLYQTREDWPEQDCLIDWLEGHARCHEISAGRLHDGYLKDALQGLWSKPDSQPPRPDGTLQAVAVIAAEIQKASAARQLRTPANP